MNPTLRSKVLFRFVVTFSLMFFFIVSFSQVQNARVRTYMTPNVNGWYEYLPKGYNDDNQTYPLMIFVHGIGELGYGDAASLPAVLRNGPPKLINAGTFPSSFTVNGQTFKFIVLSPQFISWPTPQDIQDVMDYALKNYKVNTSRVYLTGLSMGGGPVWDYTGLSLSNAAKLAAIVPVCGVSGPVDERISVLTNAHIPIWATHNLGDDQVPVSNTIGYVDKINALTLLLNPLSILSTPIVKKTIFPVNGHDAWSQTYDPSFKENNMNIYEWMLQYTNSRGNNPAPPAQNQTPSSSAGSDQWITLPNNSVTLSGGGSDPDGNITNYSWTKISGPSSYNINYGNIANPTLSGLTEGTYTFRLTVTDNSGATASDDVNIIVSAAMVTPPPSGSVAIPGKIETENFNSMFGVINEKTNDDGGGQDVGFIEYGDWMTYNVNVATAGTYTVNFRVATPNANQQLQLKSADGAVLTTVSIPQTGAFITWKTVSATVSLKAGAQTVTILSTQNGFWNINWMEFVAVNSAPSTPNLVGGNYAAVPGKIEAENYSSMFGVLSEITLDANGGLDVGWIELGDWMDYNINVAAAGNYNVNFRVAAPGAGQQLQLKSSDGSVLTTVTIPQTGSFQTWRTVSATVSLKAGNQTVRVYSSQNGWWNLNWFEFTSLNAQPAALPGYSAIPGKIESENYSNSFGILTESTADAGGGQDVGWIEYGDWMDYNVNVAAAGNYTANFRVATPYAGQQIQVRSASGAVLATQNIPQTGGFQTWRTVSVPFYLFAGNQTIRIISVQNGWLNINWMDFAAGSLSASDDPVAQGGALVSGITATNGDVPLTEQVFSIYPNPVDKVFTMQLKNNYTGAMNVQVVNLAGVLVKQYKLSKGTAVSNLNLSVGELPAGTYMVKVQIGNWTDTKKMIKR